MSYSNNSDAPNFLPSSCLPYPSIPAHCSCLSSCQPIGETGIPRKICTDEKLRETGSQGLYNPLHLSLPGSGTAFRILISQRLGFLVNRKSSTPKYNSFSSGDWLAEVMKLFEKRKGKLVAVSVCRGQGRREDIAQC